MKLCSSTIASFEVMSKSLYSSSNISVSSALKGGQVEEGWSEDWSGGRRPFSLLPGNHEQEEESRRIRCVWTVSVGAVDEEHAGAVAGVLGGDPCRGPATAVWQPHSDECIFCVLIPLGSQFLCGKDAL